MSTLALCLLLSAKHAFAVSTISPKHILIVVTSHSQLGSTGKQTGYYLSEVAHTFQVFKEAGYSVDFASITGGAPPMDEKSRILTDKANASFMADDNGIKKLNDSFPLKKVNAGVYDAVFFAGGHGVMWDFPDNPSVNTLTQKMYDRGGVVAAVCHGPAALVEVKLSNGKYLLAGKRVSGFTNEEEAAVKLTSVVPFSLEDKMLKRGARFTKAAIWQSHVEVSERLVTGQNPASAADVAKEVVKLLNPVMK